MLYSGKVQHRNSVRELLVPRGRPRRKRRGLARANDPSLTRSSPELPGELLFAALYHSVGRRVLGNFRNYRRLYFHGRQDLFQLPENLFAIHRLNSYGRALFGAHFHAELVAVPVFEAVIVPRDRFLLAAISCAAEVLDHLQINSANFH
jgi:hypothetical protein